MLATPVSITLTDDQQKALDAFYNFLIDPLEQVFVLRGYSGCGKSTLVKVLLDRLDAFNKTAKLINPDHQEYRIALTATTNKAAENLAQITGEQVTTIHSFLGLRVNTHHADRTTSLSPRHGAKKEDYLLFVDEASYIDQQLLGFIFRLTTNCKIVFIGDPAQLTPVKAHGASVFEAQFHGAELTEVVRQAQNNPIIDLSTKFRETVNTGRFFSFKPDGHHVQYLPKPAFMQAIEAEFTRPDWRYTDSKILAWTNKKVVDYNTFITERVTGTPYFQVGDYVICNQYRSFGGPAIKTDQMVQIVAIGPDDVHLGVSGNYITVDQSHTSFQPKSLADKKAALKKALKEQRMTDVVEIDSLWFDLRAVYACTINKAQGSTFDRVFVDLDDIRRCNSGDQIARMLYVGVSRARHQVILTGDLV